MHLIYADPWGSDSGRSCLILWMNTEPEILLALGQKLYIKIPLVVAFTWVVSLRARTKPSFLKRSRFDIMSCILENSRKSSRKMSLISRCNLNLSNFNQYTGILREAELLETSIREDGVEIFRTTERGREFLKDYEELKKFIE